MAAATGGRSGTERNGTSHLPQSLRRLLCFSRRIPFAGRPPFAGRLHSPGVGNRWSFPSAQAGGPTSSGGPGFFGRPAQQDATRATVWSLSGWTALAEGKGSLGALLAFDNPSGRLSGDCWRHENRCCRSCCQGCSCYGTRTARYDRTRCHALYSLAKNCRVRHTQSDGLIHLPSKLPTWPINPAACKYCFWLIEPSSWQMRTV